MLTLSLNTGAYTSEIIRGALAAVPAGQVEAARGPAACPARLLFRRVVAPIALRQALPSYATELILMTKATSLASIVTLKETMFVAAQDQQSDLPRHRGLPLRGRRSTSR